MGTVFQAADIPGQVVASINYLDKQGLTNLTTDIQRFVAYMMLWGGKAKKRFFTGTGFNVNIQYDTADEARAKGIYAPDDLDVVDNVASGSVPWRHYDTGFLFDEKEVPINGSAEKIFDLIKSRYASAYVSLAEKIESAFWDKPTDSTDNLNAFGVPYYVVPWPTGTTGLGFNGGNPVGYSAGAAGLSSTTYSRWSNYTGKYTATTKADLIFKMRQAMEETSFTSPVTIPDYRTEVENQGLYMTLSTKLNLESEAEKQNDSLGFDISPATGITLFRQMPIRWVPMLDSLYGDSGTHATLSALHPVFILDWNCMYPAHLKGFYMKKYNKLRSDSAHTVIKHFCDTSWNMRNVDRRRQICLSKLSATGTST